MPIREPRVLLVNPWIFDFAAYDLWAQPLGLLLIAAWLRNAGFSIRLLDCLDSDHPGLRGFRDGQRKKYCTSRRKPWGQGKFFSEIIEKPLVLRGVPRNYRRYGIPPEIFREELKKIDEPDVILVTSGMTYWYPGVQAAIEVIKGVYSKVPVVLGGTYASILPQHARDHSGADYVFSGIAEEGFADLLGEIIGETPGGISGSRRVWASYPALDLQRKIRAVSLLTSRGCPHRCSYCASGLLFNGFFRRKADEVVSEISYWYREKSVLDFVFYDDALLAGGAEGLMEILSMVDQEKIRCRFHSPNGIHIRGMHADLARWMMKSGWKTLRLSLESSDPDMQEKLGGKANNREFMKAVRDLISAGYAPEEIGVYVLAGLPGQKSEDVETSIRYVKETGARPILAEFSPIPGTGIWEEAVQASPFDLASEPLFHNNTILPCQGEQFTYEDLGKLKKLL